jgi:hypothetical protein
LAYFDGIKWQDMENCVRRLEYAQSVHNGVYRYIVTILFLNGLVVRTMNLPIFNTFALIVTKAKHGLNVQLQNIVHLLVNKFVRECYRLRQGKRFLQQLKQPINGEYGLIVHVVNADIY